METKKNDEKPTEKPNGFSFSKNNNSGGAREESRVQARVRSGGGADCALGLGPGWAAGSLLSLTLKKIKK